MIVNFPFKEEEQENRDFTVPIGYDISKDLITYYHAGSLLSHIKENKINTILIHSETPTHTKYEVRIKGEFAYFVDVVKLPFDDNFLPSEIVAPRCIYFNKKLYNIIFLDNS